MPKPKTIDTGFKIGKKLLALKKMEKIANQLQINLWLYGSFAVEILTNKSKNITIN